MWEKPSSPRTEKYFRLIRKTVEAFVVTQIGISAAIYYAFQAILKYAFLNVLTTFNRGFVCCGCDRIPSPSYFLLAAIASNVVSHASFLLLPCYFSCRDTPKEELLAYLERTPQGLEEFPKIFVGIFIFETCFYWGHRFLHTRMGYQFHKDHHAYYTPISNAGESWTEEEYID